MTAMDCEIGDDLLCRLCGKPASVKELKRNCPTKRGKPRVVTAEEIAAIIEHAPQPHGGPGTELKKLLSTFGIIAAPGCSCNAMAARMDAAGPDGALAMVDDVVAVMKAEAHKRGLPFVETVAAMLVRLAIKKSKRARRS